MEYMIYTIIASQNVKIPGQMDLIPGPLDKFLDNPGKPWMVGRYAIAYKNLNNMRKKLQLVIVIIKFYFNLLSVHVDAFFASLAWQKLVHAYYSQCCFGL